MPFPLLVILHVLGATIWTGGHLVLALTVLPRALRQSDPGIVTRFESGFERLALPALAAQAVTGPWLAYLHRPDVAGWFAPSDRVEAHILAKLVMLAATLALAAHARMRVIPALDAPGARDTELKRLAWHIRLITLLAVIFVLAGVDIRTGGF